MLKISLCILASQFARTFASQACKGLSIDSAVIDKFAVKVKFNDGLSTEYHHVWLRDNSPDVFDPSSGQRLKNVSHVDLSIKPKSLAVEAPNLGNYSTGLKVDWPDNTHAYFDIDFLYSNAYDEGSLKVRDSLIRPPIHANLEGDDFPAVDFKGVMDTDEGLHQWLSNMDEFGWSLVHGIPDEDGAVTKLAQRMGPLSHTHIYGNYFLVKSEPNAPNLAYSSERIPLHMDLSYYESPPGVQLLHCRRADVPGGDSILMDAHGLAEELKKRNPIAFGHLSRIPATFHKQRPLNAGKANAKAASMVYRRPHIEMTESGEIKGVFWSPPFMGPLRVPPHDVLPYYESVQAFEKLISDDPAGLKIQFRLQPGSAMTFNQRRMLHGREAFEQNSLSRGYRHFEGAYVNIDDYKSTLQLLNSKFGGLARRAGNGEH